MPWMAAVVAIAGVAMSAASMIQQGNAQSAALKSQANAARYNQQVADINAQSTQQSGAYKEQMQREKNQRLLASQKVGFAKAGVTMEGTPLDVMADTASMQEQDIIASRYNTDIQAWRYKSQGGQFGYEASRDDSMSGMPVTAGYMGAGSTLLTGAGRVMKPYMGSGSSYNSGGFGLGDFGAK